MHWIYYNNTYCNLKLITMKVEKIMQALEQKHPGESEYLQAVREVLLSVEEVYNPGV